MPTLNIRVQGEASDGDRVPTPSELLCVSGPCVPVNLTLLPDLLKAKAEKRESLPPVVAGLALIDTGASQTCFDQDAASQAKLPVVGAAAMASATDHAVEVPVFAGQLLLAGGININVEQGMGARLSGMPGVIALIGRDLLQSAVLVYNGTDGSVSLSV